MINGTPPIGGPRPLFRSLAIASSGMGAQRTRIDVIATNLANAHTTRTEEGGAYRRQVVTLEEGMPGRPMLAAGAPRSGFGDPGVLQAAVARVPRVADPLPVPAEGTGVRVMGVEVAAGEGALLYDPGHPDANDEGYVQMPNVNSSEELIDLLSSRRLFEANASVFQAVKTMLRRAAQL